MRLVMAISLFQEHKMEGFPHEWLMTTITTKSVAIGYMYFEVCKQVPREERWTNQ